MLGFVNSNFRKSTTVILLVAGSAMVVMCLFPPWSGTIPTEKVRDIARGNLSQAPSFGCYHAVWAVPTLADAWDGPDTEWPATYWNVYPMRLDTARLLIQVGAVCMLAIWVILVVELRRKGDGE